MHESIVGYFVVHVRCRRRESLRSLSHLLMSFLFVKIMKAPTAINFDILSRLGMTLDCELCGQRDGQTDIIMGSECRDIIQVRLKTFT